MKELIYYVDTNDAPTGEVCEKLKAHHKDTKLHAAFSCYVFDAQGKFLCTQRSSRKKVWANVWTNSFCGHPKPGETRESALLRRAQEELGLALTDIRLMIPKYIYKTPEFEGVVEHEFCPIYIARASSEVKHSLNEVENWLWVEWSHYITSVQNSHEPHSKTATTWSWWCKDQLAHINGHSLIREYAGLSTN
jgi:isopentenyl-diphosphate Delta-isomerase